MLVTDQKSPAIHLWHSFVKTIRMLETNAHPSSTKRLKAFISLTNSPNLDENNTSVPRITPDAWWTLTAAHGSSKQDETWKEILLGQPEGKWDTALRLHLEKQESNGAKPNMPLSTIPFVKQG